MVDKSEADGTGTSAGAKRPVREKADPSKVGSVAAPMAGEVVDVQVTPGMHLWLLLCCGCYGCMCCTASSRQTLPFHRASMSNVI